MPVSMTGFGRAERAQGGRSAVVEVRSVNHRHLVVKWRLPSRLAGSEAKLEEAVREAATRGTVEVSIRLKSESTTAARVDLELAKRYAESIRELERGAQGKRKVASKSKESTPIDWARVLQLPGVIATSDDSVADEAEVAFVAAVLEKALDELVRLRRKEGARLAAELESIIDGARDHVNAIEQRSSRLPAVYKQRLETRIKELLGNGPLALDPGTLEREVAMLADRSDVREEIARLLSHFEGFKETLARKGSVGRTLEFQVQEMGREANTIGSKMQDAEASRSVVELKTAIERLKEQVQNLE